MSSRTAIDDAVAALRAGGVVLHPTEAVWGLACDALNPAAVAAVYALKQRPADKGLILVAADVEMLRPLLAPVPEARMRAALATWPGPHTWVVPAAADAPPWLCGARGTLAVRVSAHPVVQALSRGLPGVLVSTSANLSGQPPPRTLDEVDETVRAAVAAIVSGATSGLERPTPIKNLLTGDIVRA